MSEKTSRVAVTPEPWILVENHYAPPRDPTLIAYLERAKSKLGIQTSVELFLGESSNSSMAASYISVTKDGYDIFVNPHNLVGEQIEQRIEYELARIYESESAGNISKC